jgi:hypothetical protein
LLTFSESDAGVGSKEVGVTFEKDRWLTTWVVAVGRSLRSCGTSKTLASVSATGIAT